MEDLPLHALVLAAGKGTRMKSKRAKVLHEVFFAPMIHHVVETLQKLPLQQCIVVTGHQREAVEASLADFSVSFALQEQQLGTGHAVLSAEGMLSGRGGAVLILCGDTPLISAETLSRLIDAHGRSGSELTVMTTIVTDPTNYGRILSDRQGRLLGIIEEKDATEEQKKICEVNAGIYIAGVEFLFNALKKVGTDNKQGEVYLTDIVAIANDAGLMVNRFVCDDPHEVLGVNSRIELAMAHEMIQARRNSALMAAGVTMLHPETICVEKTVTIGADTIIHPNVFLQGAVEIGSDCVIEPFVVLKNCRIGNGVRVGAFSFLNGCTIAANEIVPPQTVKTS